MKNTVILNGATCPLDAGTLSEFMVKRGYDPGRGGVAVAVNDQVVPRSGWDSTLLRSGDRLEIVEAVQGG